MDGSRIPTVVVKADEVYSPWRQSGGSVVSIGDRLPLLALTASYRPTVEFSAGKLGLAIEVLDGKDCIVVPGFIDGHVHLIGGAGRVVPIPALPKLC